MNNQSKPQSEKEHIIKARQILKALEKKLSVHEVKGEHATAEKTKDLIARAQEWVVKDGS